MKSPCEIGEPEHLTCQRCKEEFENEPLFFGGKPFGGTPKYCDECTAALRAELEKSEENEKRKRWAITQWEKTVSKEYRKTRIDHPDYPPELHETCQRWLKGEIISDSEHRPMLGLVGESGLCKTRVASQLAKRILWQGERVHWINSSQFQWACQYQFDDEKSKSAKAALEKCKNARNLVFDDIGSLKTTEVVSENLYALLELRTSRGMRMIWTSNESVDEMLIGSGITEKARSRNLSRLGGFSNILAV